MQKHTIALFDFDGTITSQHTIIHFTKFYYPKISFWLKLIKILPYVILYQAKVIGNTQMKERWLTTFFKGIELSEFQKKCNNYCQSELTKIIRPRALEKIAEHNHEKHELVMVTASSIFWVAPWAERYGFSKVIGTELEVIDFKLTGKLKGVNCNNEEKVNRIIKDLKIQDRSQYLLYGYGNSKGDKAMLEYVDKAYYRIFE